MLGLSPTFNLIMLDTQNPHAQTGLGLPAIAQDNFCNSKKLRLFGHRLLSFLSSDFLAVMEDQMRNVSIASLTTAALAIGMVISSPASAQTTPHARAKAQVEARDKQHHNKLKTEAVPAAGGAVAGGVVAGPAGAFAGAKMGHTVGSAFHGVKKHHDIKEQEKRDGYVAHRRNVSHHRTHHTTVRHGE